MDNERIQRWRSGTAPAINVGGLADQVDNRRLAEGGLDRVEEGLEFGFELAPSGGRSGQLPPNSMSTTGGSSGLSRGTVAMKFSA